MRHDRGVPTIKEAGEDNERDYDNWARFGKECVSRGGLQYTRQGRQKADVETISGINSTLSC
jgi:hypothetical protein